MWDVFISYSRKDLSIQHTITQALQNKGLQVWTDATLIPGTPIWEREIGKAIESCRCIVVLMSPHSKNSEWVMREISFARTHNRHIIPVFIQGEEQDTIPFSLVTHQRIDMRFDQAKGISSLVATVMNYLKEQQPSILKDNTSTIHNSYRLSKFQLVEASDRLHIRVWGLGAEKYINLLIQAFTGLDFSPAFQDRYHYFDWGTILTLSSDHSIVGHIRDLLTLFQEVLYIDDYLDQTFALDYYVDETRSTSAEAILTPLGESIDRAKYTYDVVKTLELVSPLEDFINRHPAYTRSDLLMTIPSSKNFHLSSKVTEHLSDKTMIENGTEFVRYVTKLDWKQRERDDQAISHGNFEITDASKVRGKAVTIVDDVYLSGTHLNELASTLKEAGASNVQGLVLAKGRLIAT